MQISRPKSRQPIPPDAQKVFEGVLFDVYQWQQEQYDGTFKTFEKLKRPDTVLVLPILEDGRIIVSRQEQPGVLPFFGPLGGQIDPGEDILEAAKRELLEESGYTASEFILWKSEHPLTKVDWVVYIFIAKDVRKIAEPSLDSGEKIELLFVTFDEFLAHAQNETFRDMAIVRELLHALVDPTKEARLRTLFVPVAR